MEGLVKTEALGVQVCPVPCNVIWHQQPPKCPSHTISTALSDDLVCSTIMQLMTEECNEVGKAFPITSHTSQSGARHCSTAVVTVVHYVM